MISCNVLLVIHILMHTCFCLVIDYWDDNFDDDKNCQDKDIIDILIKDSKCAKTSKGIFSCDSSSIQHSI